MTRDPIGYDGGENQYGYVGGDPVNWLDENGLHRGSGSGSDNPDDNAWGFNHCVNNCEWTRRLGAGVTTIGADAYERWQWFQCLTGGRLGTCRSACQPSDYKDNATGRRCAKTSLGCEVCCEQALGGRTPAELPEGPMSPERPWSTTRPLLAPLIDLLRGK